MVAAAPTSKHPYEAFLRQGQIKHALKTGLACCLAITLSYIFHLSSQQLAVIFAFLLMTMGMPSPRLNWLLVQLAIVISAIVSALLLVAFGGAYFLYLTLTLLWIFVCLLFSNWFPLAATLGAMLSAIGIFVNLHGNLGKALAFFATFELNFLVAGFSVVVVHTLIWPRLAAATALPSGLQAAVRGQFDSLIGLSLKSPTVREVPSSRFQILTASSAAETRRVPSALNRT